MKKETIKKIICLPLMTLIAGGTIAGNIIANIFEPEINSLLCQPIQRNDQIEVQGAEGQKLAKEIMQEGAVLVKNDNQVLPLSRTGDKKVNVFGHSCIDWGYGGSGSGRIRPENDDFSTTINLLQALKRYGIDYNQQLVNMYKEFRPISRQEEAQDKAFYALYEPSITDKKYYSDELLSSAKEYSSTAIVTISRFGAEGVEHSLPNNKRSDLQISLEEEELLEYVGKNYEKVIVVVNSANVMELGFLETIEGIDACLVVGLTGTQAASAIPSLLFGEISPSGKLADTYPYSFKDYIYYNNLNQNGFNKPNVIIDYVEGIYVGYKWFETADEEGYWNNIDNQYGKGYNGVVQYPFGYGLSYSSFDWEIISTTIREKDTIIEDNVITAQSEISLKVNVTNTGNMAAKDVVEVYLTAPYIEGSIEKASVNLVGFEKTVLLDPGKSQEIELTFFASDLASYDCYDLDNNNFKGYELEKGTYELKLMTDAHNLKESDNNVVSLEVAETINVENDRYTGNKVTNLFTGADAIDGSSLDGNDDGVENVKYISRKAFPALNESLSNGQRSLNAKQEAIKNYTKEQAEAWDNATEDKFGNPTHMNNVKWNQNNGLSITDESGNVTDLGFKLGADYNAVEWEQLLDQLSIEETVKLISTGYAKNLELNSIGKPALSDYDGPMQVKGFTGGPRSTGFPIEPVLAQTWNKLLAKNMGLSFGREMNSLGVSGLYGFGCNIHRNPFNGRNFEYLSEDGYLSGAMLASSIMGIQNAGRYGYIKHLALNECEAGRNGAFTFCTEQALREIYLKPFQMAVQEGGCVSIMSAYNRVGARYSGGSEALLQGVLRQEWGFKGTIITDCSGPSTSYYMNMDLALRSGGDLGMATPLNSSSSPYTLNYSETSTNRLQYQMREAAHHITYMYLRTQYLNKVYNETADPNNIIISLPPIESWQWWRVVIVELDIFVTLSIVLWGYYLFRNKEFFIEDKYKNKEKKI